VRHTLPSREVITANTCSAAATGYNKTFFDTTAGRAFKLTCCDMKKKYSELHDWEDDGSPADVCIKLHVDLVNV
jgi:hypothetical protein